MVLNTHLITVLQSYMAFNEANKSLFTLHFKNYFFFLNFCKMFQLIFNNFQGFSSFFFEKIKSKNKTYLESSIKNSFHNFPLVNTCKFVVILLPSMLPIVCFCLLSLPLFRICLRCNQQPLSTMHIVESLMLSNI